MTTPELAGIAFSDSDDLLEVAEKLRMHLREALGADRTHFLSQKDYDLSRIRLLSWTFANSLLPHWLHDQPSVDGALRELGGPAIKPNLLPKLRKKLENDFAPSISQLENEMASKGEERGSITSRRIRLRVSHFFNTPMRVEPRLSQVFALSPHDRNRQIDTLWRNILLHYPTIAATLQRALPDEAGYASLLRYLAPVAAPDYASELSDHFVMGCLKEAFVNQHTGDQKACIDSIKEAGQLAAVDILSGFVSGPLRSYNRTIPPLAMALKELEPQLRRDRRYLSYASDFTDRLNHAFKLVGMVDKSFGEQQFALFDHNGRIRIRPFGSWSFCRPNSSSASQRSLFRADVIQPVSSFSTESLEALEDLIDSEAHEVEFQRFFVRHPEYLQVLGRYSKVHPQLVLTDDSGDRLIPDFLLEGFDDGFCDLCDLKRPTELIFKESNSRLQLRDRVMAGLNQLRTYRTYFDDRNNRRRFEDAYPGLKAYRPRVILIVGRSESFYAEMDRIKLLKEFSDKAEILTYDDVLGAAREWKSRMTSWVNS